MGWPNTDEADLRQVKLPAVTLIYDSTQLDEDQAVQRWMNLLMPINAFTKSHGIALSVSLDRR